MRTKLFLLSAFVVVLSACYFGNQKKENYTYYRNSGEIFHTFFDFKYAYSQSLEDEIMAELEKFDQSLNPFKEHTIISKVNNNEPVELDSFFVDVFTQSKIVSENTYGKFDITVSPLINAWGFGFKNINSVTPAIIDSLKTFVGFEKISIDPDGKISKTDPRVQINTSAIAKGYACDVVANLLRKHGVENFMVYIGGEIVAQGLNDRGECWRIGIDKPIDDSTGVHHELQTLLAICDKSMATSGNYRNYYIKDGKKYAHTIDPHTGYPSEQDLLSVTVLADDCMTADAYATAFMALGLEKSEEVARKVAGLAYYFIYAKPNNSLGVAYSAGFEQFFVNKLDILMP